MNRRYNKDAHFASSLETLLKIKNKKELAVKVKKLEKYVIENHNPFLAFRLSIELDERNISTTKLQNFIINSRDAKYIYKYAREIRRANVKKLQNAIMECGNILQITHFGCFIRGANKKIIEDMIIEADNPKSAYLYLRFVKFCNIKKLKHIIIKSKRPRYLFELAKFLKNKKEIEEIQNLIIDSASNTYVRLFAVHIKGADIKKLEDRIISTKNVGEMKKFAKAVKSPRLLKLSLLF